MTQRVQGSQSLMSPRAGEKMHDTDRNAPLVAKKKKQPMVMDSRDISEGKPSTRRAPKRGEQKANTFMAMRQATRAGKLKEM